MMPSEEAKRKFIESIKSNGYKVKTDTGYSDVKYSHKTIEYEVWELITTRYTLKCADTHIVFYSNVNNEVLSEVYVKDLKSGDLISTKYGYDTVISVNNLGYSENMYDLELDDDNHRYYTSNILSHNSAVSRAFILWYALFNEDKVVAILANKLNLAQEQLQQLRDSYINLPYWMQPGVKQWNKRGVQFSHGTRIVCAATSPDGIRGMSINLLYLDEFAFIKSHIADEFIASVFPTISSGKTTKVIITSTPFGMNHFFRMWEDAMDEDQINDETGDESNGYVRSQIPWNAVPGRDANWARDEMKKIGEIRFNQEYMCIDYDEIITIKNIETHEIIDAPIGILYETLNESNIKTSNYLINTPNGFKSFHGVAKYPPQQGIILTLSNGNIFKCANQHKIKTVNGLFIEAQHSLNQILSSGIHINNITNDVIQKEYYDILEVEGHEYISSELVSHNCEFVGSVSTLIDHHFLKKLESKKPMKIPNLPEYIRIYAPPLKKEKLEAEGWEYVASLDSGYGVHQDSSVLQIFLVKSNITVHQVAVISSNKMDIDLFCKKCYVILKKYHEPSLIIEQNGPGIAAMKFFYNSVEYENILHFDPSGRHMGLWASEKTKQNACILFKTYIERKFMTINDRATINEMHSFGKVTQERWGGLGGNNDDHITSAYWIPFYLQSPYYYGKVVEVNLKEMEEDEVILKTEEELAEERIALEKVQNKGSLMKEMENNAKYLSNSGKKPSKDDDDDSVTGIVMFQR